MAEYVDREALLNELEKINPVDYGWIGDYEVHRGCSECLRDCKNAVDALQVADVMPVVHGHWVKHTKMPGIVYCSSCKEVYLDEEWLEAGKWGYCPNCGARMDGEAE